MELWRTMRVFVQVIRTFPRSVQETHFRYRVGQNPSILSSLGGCQAWEEGCHWHFLYVLSSCGSSMQPVSTSVSEAQDSTVQLTILVLLVASYKLSCSRKESPPPTPIKTSTVAMSCSFPHHRAKRIQSSYYLYQHLLDEHWSLFSQKRTQNQQLS